MTHWFCPYCGEELPDAQSPHCGEAGHAEPMDEDEDPPMNTGAIARDLEYWQWAQDEITEKGEHK